MKKEFITNWSKETIETMEPQVVMRNDYYDRLGQKMTANIIRPDDIKFHELLYFLGKKTKVTIETIETVEGKDDRSS